MDSMNGTTPHLRRQTIPMDYLLGTFSYPRLKLLRLMNPHPSAVLLSLTIPHALRIIISSFVSSSYLSYDVTP